MDHAVFHGKMVSEWVFLLPGDSSFLFLMQLQVNVVIHVTVSSGTW